MPLILSMGSAMNIAAEEEGVKEAPASGRRMNGDVLTRDLQKGMMPRLVIPCSIGAMETLESLFVLFGQVAERHMAVDAGWFERARDLTVVVGVSAGVMAALCQSVSYLFSRRYMVREGHGSWELFSLSHTLTGVMALLLLPVLWPENAPPFGTYVRPLLCACGCYLLAQVGLFAALRWTDPSRVSPLLGLKILMLACFTAAACHSAFLRDLLALDPVSPLQWAAVFATAFAALLLNESGGRIPAAGIVCVLFTCLGYCLSDLSIFVLVQRLGPVGTFRAAMLGCCMVYVLLGLGALLALPKRPFPPWEKWRLALPVAVSWLLAMGFLYLSFKLIGVLFGNVVQSTRGLISIVLGMLVVKRMWLHLEARVERGALWRRVVAALLMTAAIAAFLIG